MRKLGQPSVKLSDAEKENLSEVLDVLLKYSNINKDSKCPHIEGKNVSNCVFWNIFFQSTKTVPTN